MGFNTKSYRAYLKEKQKAISIFIIVFYVVGVAGMLLPCTFQMFLKLIPLALILSFVTLAFFHANKFVCKITLAFLFIYVISFTVEAMGVCTGQIFGHYQYGEGLGFKIFQTPVIIGVNWLFLVYTTSAVVEKLKIHVLYKILVASTFMLLYDIVLEQVAPTLDMWYWKNEIVPFQNYLAWFALALVFHSLLKILKIKIENKFAFIILCCQFLFFLLLLVGFKFVV